MLGRKREKDILTQSWTLWTEKLHYKGFYGAWFVNWGNHKPWTKAHFPGSCPSIFTISAHSLQPCTSNFQDICMQAYLWAYPWEWLRAMVLRNSDERTSRREVENNSVIISKMGPARTCRVTSFSCAPPSPDDLVLLSPWKSPSPNPLPFPCFPLPFLLLNHPSFICPLLVLTFIVHSIQLVLFYCSFYSVSLSLWWRPKSAYIILLCFILTTVP